MKIMGIFNRLAKEIKKASESRKTESSPNLEGSEESQEIQTPRIDTYRSLSEVLENDQGYERLSPREAKKAFFDFPLSQMSKYYKPLNSYKPRMHYDTREIRQDLTDIFNNYLLANDFVLGNDFVDEAMKKAKSYHSMQIGPHEADNLLATALLFAQLKTLVYHPVFLKHPRIVEFIEVFADQKYNVPWDFNMYVNYKNHAYQLKEGFNLDHIPSIEKLIDDKKLWTGKSSELRRMFFGSIAELIEKLSSINSVETLPLRLKLLENAVEYDYHSSGIVRQSLVYTFKTDGDRFALQEIANKKPDSIIGKEAKKILAGKYDNVAW